MPDVHDFEQAWLEKFRSSLDKVVGDETRREVMNGSAELSSQSSRKEVIDWSRRAMERLDKLVDKKRRQEIMTGCACQYPRAALGDVRQRYSETGDINLVHGMLQEQFESFLRETMGLDDDLIGEIVGRGWGLAGIRQGDTIIATKIPKSGYLLEYLQETDPELKRQLYCHCPRIRDVLKGSESISTTYCYCGAGYYKDIWEEIIQRPVQVELLESVMDGGQVCKVAIHLPSD